jgi:hypothetical protein
MDGWRGREGDGDNGKIKDQQSTKREACTALNDYRRTIKIAFGMPRGFFSPSWTMSSGVFEADMLSLQMSERSWENSDKDKEDRSNLYAISRIGKTGTYLLLHVKVIDSSISSTSAPANQLQLTSLRGCESVTQ